MSKTWTVTITTSDISPLHGPTAEVEHRVKATDERGAYIKAHKLVEESGKHVVEYRSAVATVPVPKHLETLIRRTIPGSAKIFADARKVARTAVLAGDSQSLRDQAGDDGIISGGFRAVADALDKLNAERARREAANAELRHAIENGCPTCGAKLRRNLSLTGWWQCSQLGAVGFRADASKPSCSFQGFLVEE